MRAWLPALIPVALVVSALDAFVPRGREACIREAAFEPRAAAIMMPFRTYDFKVRVRVERHADHRVLVLSWDGPQSGRSFRQLDGDESEVTHRFEFKGLPGGRYGFQARVVDNNGRISGLAELETVYAEEDK